MLSTSNSSLGKNIGSSDLINIVHPTAGMKTFVYNKKVLILHLTVSFALWTGKYTHGSIVLGRGRGGCHVYSLCVYVC